VDILVATPGRLLDHARQQGTLDLQAASRSWCWTRRTGCSTWASSTTSAACSRCCQTNERQNLLFSATFSAEIRKLANGYLEQPGARSTSHRRNTAAETVSRSCTRWTSTASASCCPTWCGANNWRQVLVFTRTKHGANRLAEQLEGKTASPPRPSTATRARAPAPGRWPASRQGNVRVLVATDIAARGLDIDQLPHVVNFELPNVPEDYVHRIGRTGRAGNPGTRRRRFRLRRAPDRPGPLCCARKLVWRALLPCLISD
jgi:ATP-dependent RNA helicase RhlE